MHTYIHTYPSTLLSGYLVRTYINKQLAYLDYPSYAMIRFLSLIPVPANNNVPFAQKFRRLKPTSFKHTNNTVPAMTTGSLTSAIGLGASAY